MRAGWRGPPARGGLPPGGMTTVAHRSGPRRSSMRVIPRAITARVGGISSSRPTTSEMKPGVSRKAPPTITKPPLRISRCGTRPALRASPNAAHARRPCDRHSQAPMIESTIRSATVGRAPIAWPTWMIT